jgi:hypothetical protein
MRRDTPPGSFVEIDSYGPRRVMALTKAKQQIYGEHRNCALLHARARVVGDI